MSVGLQDMFWVKNKNKKINILFFILICLNLKKSVFNKILV